MENTLIVSTGDISDADGFLGLSEYALQTNSDILFIMNYPAFIGKGYHEENTETDGFKGFNYGLKQILKASFGLLQENEYINIGRQIYTYDSWLKDKYNLDNNDDYIAIMKAFGINKEHIEDAENLTRYMKALTAISYYFTQKIVKECNPKTFFYFMVGGINTINPFNYKAYKDELLLYSKIINEHLDEILNYYYYNLDTLFDENNVSFLEDSQFDITSYDNIYIDGNGSFSFFDGANDIFSKNFDSIRDKIRGVYVMGGVLSDVESFTLSKIDNVIHRLSISTMNQLYNPYMFLLFLNLIRKIGLADNIYFLPNHSVLEDTKLLEKITTFLSGYSKLLVDICSTYYAKGPQKPFDFFTSRAIVMAINKELDFSRPDSFLHYNGVYGISLLTDSFHIENYNSLTVCKKDIEKGFDLNSMRFYKIPCKLLTIASYFDNTPISKDKKYDYSDIFTDDYFEAGTYPMRSSYSQILGLYSQSQGGGHKKKPIRRLKSYK